MGNNFSKRFFDKKEDAEQEFREWISLECSSAVSSWSSSRGKPLRKNCPKFMSAILECKSKSCGSSWVPYWNKRPSCIYTRFRSFFEILSDSRLQQVLEFSRRTLTDLSKEKIMDLTAKNSNDYVSRLN